MLFRKLIFDTHILQDTLVKIRNGAFLHLRVEISSSIHNVYQVYNTENTKNSHRQNAGIQKFSFLCDFGFQERKLSIVTMHAHLCLQNANNLCVQVHPEYVLFQRENRNVTKWKCAIGCFHIGRNKTAV